VDHHGARRYARGYLDDVVAYANQFGADLDGLRIAIDCGNGMAAPATPTVLRRLGAEGVTLNGNVDGHFPGRGSKPTPETLADLRAFIADANADVAEPGRPADGRDGGERRGGDGDDSQGSDGDAGDDEGSGSTEGFAFGIGHDGDADRIVVVDADGEIVHEDTVVAVLAERYVAESDAADPVVVTTPNASGRIDERVRAAGGRVERVRLGALHEGIAAVRETAADGSEAGADDGGTRVVFAAEPWKHVHVGFGGWIDGVASAAVIARLVAGEGLDALREPVSERPYRKISVPCPDDAKAAVMDRLETALPDAFPDAAVNTDYGVRLEFDDASWTLVRSSGTEPYVRVYAESDDVNALVAEVEGTVEAAVRAVDSAA